VARELRAEGGGAWDFAACADARGVASGGRPGGRRFSAHPRTRRASWGAAISPHPGAPTRTRASSAAHPTKEGIFCAERLTRREPTRAREARDRAAMQANRAQEPRLHIRAAEDDACSSNFR